MKTRKYQLPPQLSPQLGQQLYERWLSRKAAAHKKRDRARGNATATREGYMLAIHDAVIRDGGRDAYTGEELRWDLISTYDNERSKSERRLYKAVFARMPTVDHAGNGLGPADFRICAWQTNSAKSDILVSEFVDLCRRVVAHFGTKS